MKTLSPGTVRDTRCFWGCSDFFRDSYSRLHKKTDCDRIKLVEREMGAADVEEQQEDIEYMQEALRLARKAAEAEDTPIGAVIVYQGQIIGRGYNRRNALGSPLAHAEIEAIHQAADFMGDWRLENTTLYVTLEPCPMCAGAIVQARIPKVVIGAMNPKAGCAGSILNLLEHTGFNHRAQVCRGVLEEESAGLMRSFFEKLRRRERIQRQEESQNAEV